MKLADLVPTILIEPDNVDKPFGLMATNDQGHLIIYPNTNLKLHCLFPENQLGWPTWEAEQFSTGFTYPIHARTSQHRSTVEFDAITSRFSGIYTCKSPYNKKHSITMVVEDVKCPVFQVNSEQEKALTYNGHPDGGERILTTTAQFFCEGGSSIAATCLPNGNWSISAPTMEECPPKRAKIWGCDVFIKQSDDDPEVKYDNHKHEIRFSCTGNRRLVGGAVATCIHNTWTLSPFPKCK
ncbi:Locomotion-related protein Hikaru genki like protein [Argiope bruennichi]|uniref:Locomotion-related protein Hikaru genki like protein n=2 Tax=Argiope bruennichi TaxID=94029 RepID=A0A8T0ENW5_ARGBR|nr:Locomotion-related protein Hikaru genki like protein [Argiope bruennichi]